MTQYNDGTRYALYMDMDTTSKATTKSNHKPNHEIWITVSPSGSVLMEVLMHAADRPEVYSFVNWGHMLGQFGVMFALTDCVIRVKYVSY